MDHTNFTPNGPRASSSTSEDHHWWTLTGDEAAASITATINALHGAQSERRTQLTIGERLYGNATALGIASASAGQAAALPASMREKSQYNVVESAIDTLASKTSKMRPQPLFLTNGGNFKQRRKAKKLTKFVDGVSYECKAPERRREALLDGFVWGDGITHVFEQDDRVAMERVLPSELLVDEQEAVYGKPRQMHRLKLVDRSVLADAFPGKRSVIERAGDAETGVAGTAARVSDLVLVRESWRLPSGKGAKDGRHCISVDGHLLTPMEPWTRNRFPFARFRWKPRLKGYWSQGIAEQLQPVQFQINRDIGAVNRSYHLAGTFKVWLPVGSKISKEHINNDIGTVSTFTGQTPPVYITPPIVQPEIYTNIDRNIARAFAQCGVSQLSAASQKPAGLDSGKALREFSDIESERFQTTGDEIEAYVLDVAALCIATAREIAERLAAKSETPDKEGAKPRRSYKVRVPETRAVSDIDWADIDLSEDDYVMKCFPVSALASDPAGRLKDVQEMAAAGYLTPRQAKRLLAFPDLEQDESLANAQEEYLTQILDRIVDDGEMTPPEPFDDLAMARELALQYYAIGKTQDLEPDRLELLRAFITQIEALEIKAMPPPLPPGLTAPPVPTPPSDLVPQTLQ